MIFRRIEFGLIPSSFSRWSLKSKRMDGSKSLGLMRCRSIKAEKLVASSRYDSMVAFCFPCCVRCNSKDFNLADQSVGMGNGTRFVIRCSCCRIASAVLADFSYPH